MLAAVVFSNGVSRTGTFCVVYAAIDEINQGNGILPVPELVCRLRRQRRSLVQYKEQLKFCYDTILCYAQDVLIRRKQHSMYFIIIIIITIIKNQFDLCGTVA